MGDERASTRCFVCDALERRRRADGRTLCLWCGAAWEPGFDKKQSLLRSALSSRLVAGAVNGLGDDDGRGRWHLDSYTLRIAATRAGLWLIPGEGTTVSGHARDPASGTLVPLHRFEAARITAVCLARANDPACETALNLVARQFDAVVVMLDGASDAAAFSDASLSRNVQIVRRSLNGDFGAQRTAAHAHADTDWLFHIDLDETLSPGVLATLPQLATAAHQAGLRAVGFQRCNLVDGMWSDHFPDTQYRLVHRDVTFAGHVHERPDACDSYATTTVALTGPLLHHLACDRVVARRRTYDALGQTADRHADDGALLRPFDAMSPLIMRA
ncbi:MAG: hypothetical protein AAGG99_00900 [Pseudomonadota bacterium]